jgi:hypothetical protein
LSSVAWQQSKTSTDIGLDFASRANPKANRAILLFNSLLAPALHQKDLNKEPFK